VLDGVDVLLVEDHEDTRDALQLLLRNRGATVRVAGTAAEALALYETRRPTILVSDLGLPLQSGIDLIQRIRREEAARGLHTPAIAASGFVGGGHQQQALEAGFDAQLAKPIDLAALLQAIRALLAPKSG
jgi:CheY-like chemotaxis protein